MSDSTLDPALQQFIKEQAAINKALLQQMKIISEQLNRMNAELHHANELRVMNS